MNPSVSLCCEELRCELQPALGGCVAGLWWQDLPILQSTPATQLQSVRQAASYPLVPFSNRMSQAVLQWGGRTYPLLKNWAPDPHTIHGVGWERPWTVLDQTSDGARLEYRHSADAAWPFDFVCVQTFQLEAQALAMTLHFTNLAPHVAPVGLGWHPFFVKHSGSHLTFDATGRWEMGPDQLPSHLAPHTGLNTPTEHLVVDHCFDGWTGLAVLHNDRMTLSVRSSLRRLVVYTLPSRGDVAIEPVSHANNAMNLLAGGQYPAESLGVVVLQPGESTGCDMRIDFQPHPEDPVI